MKIKIGIFADKGMGKWLVQSFEPIGEYADITLFIPENNKHDHRYFSLPKHLLTHKHETMLTIKRIGRYIRTWLHDNERLTHVEFYPFSLEEYFSKNQFDIILTKSDRSLYTLSRLKDKFKYKLVYRYPYTLPFTHIFDKRSEFTRRKAFNKIDHFICISETAKKNLEFEGIDGSRIDVVLNSVDLSFFSPGKKNPYLLKKLGISPIDKVILFVGKLTSWKNPFTILYASKILLQKGIPVKILLAGQGAQKKNLQKMSSLLNINERVVFLNFIENNELNQYYRLADVLVMPSMTILTWEDQFPFAVVEAMASGVPVIVTNSGGMPELVGDAGRVFPQGNYRELSEHLIAILTNEGLRQLMSNKSRQRAELMFDNKKNSIKILSIFLKILGRD
jgi:glycosyltransferase involved in cell wall biosynthesis